MKENEILEFNPSSLSIYEDKQKPNYVKVMSKDYDFFDLPKRTKNYPIESYYVEKKPKNAEDTVVYVFLQMITNSNRSINWLQGRQFDERNTKNTTAHNNKKNQILDYPFFYYITTKWSSIEALTKKFESKCDVYEIPYNYYKELRDKFVNYIYPGKETVLKQQIVWFVEGIFKHVMSANWEYDNFRYILEDEKYSKQYYFDNGKWVKC